MTDDIALRDFFPVSSGEVREAVPDYGDESEEGEPVELSTHRSLAKSLESGSVRLLTAAKAKAGADGRLANMDELISGLLRLERDAQALFSPFLDQPSRAESLIRALEALRDCRWQMMALRADTDRDHGAPTFSEAGDLRRFLDGLS